MTEPDARIARLPKWAQDRISTLERKVAAREQTIAELTGADERPPVAVRDAYNRETGPIPVAWDRYDTIRFYPEEGSDGSWIDVRVPNPGSGEISITANYAICIRTQSSNVINVRNEGI